MGIFDSSRTRVAPVFGHLQCLDPSGRLWLQGLLELANTRKAQTPDAGPSRLRVAKWWPREARLAAMDRCIGELDDSSRDLVREFYVNNNDIGALAQKQGRATQTLYNKLNTLRRLLADCMKRRMAQEA